MLRLSERYISFQGEGPNTGKQTVFVRFAGCNFKCAGWACDTQHAIDPTIFTREQQLLEPEELANRIIGDHVTNVCLTGGEPFLQNQKELHALIMSLKDAGRTVEVFTNGSLLWDLLKINLDYIDNVIMDWKLPGSGEFPDEERMLTNLANLCNRDAIKFTVKDRDDFDCALRIWTSYIQPIANRPVVWCGPVWGSLTSEKVAKWIVNSETQWNLNTQVHKYIWSPDARGV